MTDDDEVDIDGTRYRRLEQDSSATYFGPWGSHEIAEPLYREVGVHNGPTIEPIERRAGMIARAYLVLRGRGQRRSEVLARRVSADVAHLIHELPGLFVNCVQDGAPELLILPKMRYLILEALPASQPDYGTWPEDSLRFRFTYDVLPRHLIPRLLVESHRLLTATPTRWRTGAVLTAEGCPILLCGDRDRCRLDIAVAGPATRRHLLELEHRYGLEHRSTPKMLTARTRSENSSRTSAATPRRPCRRNANRPRSTCMATS